MICVGGGRQGNDREKSTSRSANGFVCWSEAKNEGGVLSYGEIMDSLQKQELSADEMDDMYESFSNKGIEIVDEIAEAEPAEDADTNNEQHEGSGH